MSKTNNGKKNRFVFLTVLILISIGSCASVVGEKRPHVYLTNSAKYVLISPAGIKKPMDMAQYISASYGGQDYYFNAWVKADETGMDIVLFNELGSSMGDLFYRDGVVDISSNVFPASLKPEYIIADFQLCFYDPVLLKQALKACGLTLETRGEAQPGYVRSSVPGVRRILKGKNLIIEIEETRDAVKFVNHLREYTYTLQGEFE